MMAEDPGPTAATGYDDARASWPVLESREPHALFVSTRRMIFAADEPLCFLFVFVLVSQFAEQLGPPAELS